MFNDLLIGRLTGLSCGSLEDGQQLSACPSLNVIPIFSFTGKCKIMVLLKDISQKVGMLLMREVEHKREMRKGRKGV